MTLPLLSKYKKLQSFVDSNCTDKSQIDNTMYWSSTHITVFSINLIICTLFMILNISLIYKGIKLEKKSKIFYLGVFVIILYSFKPYLDILSFLPDQILTCRQFVNIHCVSISNMFVISGQLLMILLFVIRIDTAFNSTALQYSLNITRGLKISYIILWL